MDTTRHHLRYVDSREGLVPPANAALFSQIQGATLAAGDSLVMQDGMLLAKVVNNLTDFTTDLTQAHCEELLRYPPELVVCKRTPYGLVFARRVYAERSVITPQGAMSSQLLVEAFGEPAWINKGRLDVVCNEWQYQEMQARGQISHA